MNNFDSFQKSCLSGAIAVVISGASSAALEIQGQVPVGLAGFVDAARAMKWDSRQGVFEQNIGQFDESILFYAESESHALWVVSDGIALRGRSPFPDMSPVKLRFGDLTAFTSTVGVSAKSSTTDYFLKHPSGKSETVAAPNFGRVVAKGVMFGVDAHVYFAEGQFEYDLISTSGLMPRSILIRVEGAIKLTLNDVGDLIIHDAYGHFAHRAPRVFESDLDGKREIKSFYRLIGMDDVELVIERENQHAEVAVDPVLAYSGYVGGSAQFEVSSVSTDAAGNVFVAGNRTRANVVNPTIAKLSPSGTLGYQITIPTNAQTTVKKIAVDKSGNLAVVGSTCASNFPTLNAVFPTAPGGMQAFLGRVECDGFVAKFDGETGNPIFATYLGSSDGGDTVTDVAIDDQDRIHVVGITGSTNFPTLATNFPKSSVLPAAFYARFTPVGSIEAMGRTGLGAVDASYPPKLVLDNFQNAVFAGAVQASGGFPASNFDSVYPASLSGINGYVAAVDTISNSIAYASLIGGSGGSTYVADLVADDYGSVYLLGNTGATQSFLQGKTLSQSGFSGSNNFLVRIDRNRQAPIIGSSISSANISQPASIGSARFLPYSGTPTALTLNRNTRELTMALGFALPKSASYEISLNGVLPTPNNLAESIIIHAAPDGQVLYATKLGGSGSSDYPTSLELDSSGNYITGGFSDSYFSTAYPAIPTSYVGTKPAAVRSATLAKVTAPIFYPQFDVRPGFERVSNVATLNSSGSQISLSISQGGEFSVGCSSTFSTAPTSVPPGSKVCVRHIAEQSYSAIKTTVLKVDGVDEPFFSVSASADDLDGDGIPDAVEHLEGLNWKSKDNSLFSKGTSDSDRLFVMQQYRDFLGREADPVGLPYWTGLLTAGTLSREQLTRSFFDSQEFQAGVPSIVRLYLGFFKRIPDHVGLWGWVSSLRAGMPLATIASAFAASQEFQATYGALDDVAFVTRLYLNILNRSPDAAGLNGWVNQLKSGYSRGEIVLGFSESPEHRALTANDVRVIMQYEGMLRRAAEADGFAYWVRYLASGNDSLALTRGFLFSQEYRNRFLN